MSNVDVDLPSTAVVVELSEGSVNVPVIGASPGGTGDGGTFDGEHNDLDGRSTADAHPISAITGLTAALVGLQTVGWDFLYDGVNFDLSTDEIDGVPRTVVLAAGARVGTHELPLRAATESDAGQHWSIEYFCGGDGFTVLRVPDPLGESPQYVDLAGLKVDGWIVDMVGVWDSDTETGFWALHAIHDRRGDESGGGAVDSVNGETGVVVLDAADVGAVDVALVGAANGIAELDSGGLVPSSQLPSYVDDVIEAANFAALPGTGETGKIYVTLDNNLTYRWSGSAYVEISASLALGETSTTAYRGDRGKTAYDHSQVVTGNPHGTTAADVGAQPSDADLTAIAGLSPSNDDFLQRKAGAWTNRTPAQAKVDLGITGPVTSYGGMPPKAGQWVLLGPSSSSGSTTTFGTTASNSNGEIKFQPFWVGKRIGVSGLALEIGAANDGGSAVLRVGIFADNDGRPGTLIEQGSASINTATTKEITWTEVFLDPGWYWAAYGVQALNTSGTNPTFRMSGGAMPQSSMSSVPNGSTTQHNQRIRAAITGTFASNPTIGTEIGSALPSLWLKVSTP